MGYGDVWGCKMGLLSPQNPKNIYFPADPGHISGRIGRYNWFDIGTEIWPEKIFFDSVDPGDPFCTLDRLHNSFCDDSEQISILVILTEISHFRFLKIFRILILGRNFDEKIFGQNFYTVTWGTPWGTLRTKIQLRLTEIATFVLLGAEAILGHFWEDFEFWVVEISAGNTSEISAGNTFWKLKIISLQHINSEVIWTNPGWYGDVCRWKCSWVQFSISLVYIQKTKTYENMRNNF